MPPDGYPQLTQTDQASGDGLTTAAVPPMEARARKTAIDLCGLAHIHLSGLCFRGAGLRTDRESQHLRLERLRGEYVAHSYLRDVSDEAILIDGSDHVILGCDFGYSSGSVLRLRGRHHKLLQNHIHHGNYGGLWSGTLSLAGRRHVVSHNTVCDSGRDLLSLHGLTESLIEHNDLSRAGWLTHDLGITYGHDTDFGGTIIRRNRVHDCVASGLAEGIYFDHCSHNVVVCENLIWNIPGMPIQVNNPGYFNLIAHNSCFATSTSLSKITSFDHSHRQDLFGCHFLSNLVNGPYDLPDNAVVAGNIVSPDPGYEDPAAQGFRLREDPQRASTAATGDGQNSRTAPQGAGLHGDKQRASTVAPIRIQDSGRASLAGALQKGQPCWPAGHGSGMLVDESVEWQRPSWAYTNRLVNAAFELGSLEGWRPSSVEQVTIVPGNGWGNKVAGTEMAATGTSRHELQLTGASQVEQEVTGLPPETRFQLSAWVRADQSAGPVVLEAVAPDITAIGADTSAPTVVHGVAGAESMLGPGPSQKQDPGHCREATCIAIRAESRAPQWQRVVLQFCTGGVGAVVVRVSHLANTADAQARVDNLGLLEAD
jgi:hypothetical protein